MASGSSFTDFTDSWIRAPKPLPQRMQFPHAILGSNTTPSGMAEANRNHILSVCSRGVFAGVRRPTTSRSLKNVLRGTTMFDVWKFEYAMFMPEVIELMLHANIWIAKLVMTRDFNFCLLAKTMKPTYQRGWSASC